MVGEVWGVGGFGLGGLLGSLAEVKWMRVMTVQSWSNVRGKIIWLAPVRRHLYYQMQIVPIL